MSRFGIGLWRNASAATRAAAIAGIALIAVGLALQSSGPVAFTSPKAAQPLILGARLTRPLVIDGGALRLDPPIGSPTMSESRALALWQSQGFGGSVQVTNVDVFLARATMRVLPKSAGDTLAAPSFKDRTVWAFVWDGGPHSCPPFSYRTRVSSLPEPRTIEMLAGDSSREGVSYRTRGSLCGGAPTGPSAGAASYSVSVPWQILRLDTVRCTRTNAYTCRTYNKSATIQVTMPACARIGGGFSSGGGNEASTLAVIADVPVNGGPCPDDAKHEIITRPVIGTPMPPRIGLIHGFQTGANVLTYFDGSSHTIRVSS